LHALLAKDPTLVRAEKADADYGGWAGLHTTGERWSQGYISGRWATLGPELAVTKLTIKTCYSRARNLFDKNRHLH
jgi:hypothetical protein